MVYKAQNGDSSKGNTLRKDDYVGSMNYSNSGSIKLESATARKN